METFARCPYCTEGNDFKVMIGRGSGEWFVCVVGREELFERERGSDPDFQVWDGCAMACEGVAG